MGTPSISHYGAGTADTQTVLAGFDGGYFLTDGGTADRFKLWNVTAPDTELDAYTIESTGRYVAHNTAGSVYAIGSASATTDYLASVANVAEVITVGTAGTFTVTPSSTRHVGLSYDGTEFLWHSGSATQFKILSTADASVTTSTTDASFSGNWVVAAAGSGRAIVTDKSTGQFELWSTSQLDSLAFPYTVNGTNPSPVIPVGAERLFFCMGIDEGADPVQLWCGVIDTTGDTLTYVWQKVITTTWDAANTSAMLADVYGGYAFIAPRDQFYDDPSSLYAVNVSTGYVRASNSLTNTAPGARLGGPFFCGADYAVWTENRSPFHVRMWAFDYTLTDAASLLRQRQSPKRTPSRVRGIDLRQRQTPYIG